jgi:flagellar basal body P-ring protein FlgI
MSPVIIKRCLTGVLLVSTAIAGCGPPARPTSKIGEKTQVSSSATIGELTEVFIPQAIPIEGYALVGNLKGAGSSQCPPAVRQYLEQYMLKQLPAKTNVSAIIDSADTAVVHISGNIPANASKNDRFDLKVVALAGTQTTSLEGGILLGAELKVKGQFSTGTKTLALAEGPVFINSLGDTPVDKRSGFILAGGRVLNDSQISLVINNRNYHLTRHICDRINEGFGSATAKAVMPGQITLSIPDRYKGQENHFLALLKATYLFASAQNQKIDSLISGLANSENKLQSETTLEAIGIAAAEKLASLLNSADEKTRLAAARCLLNIGDDRGLEPLRTIALDKNSKYRIEALEAISFGAKRSDASAILQRLLRDDDFNIVLAAYRQLCKIDDIAVSRQIVGRNFYLDIVPGSSKQFIYVSRSGTPLIVLFGDIIYCRVGTFAQSDDGSIIINATENLDNVQVIRKLPNIPPIKVECSYKLSDIIGTLCEEAELPQNSPRKPGLNAPYADMISIVKQLCDKQAVFAQFFAGPLPKID